MLALYAIFREGRFLMPHIGFGARGGIRLCTIRKGHRMGHCGLSGNTVSDACPDADRNGVSLRSSRRPDKKKRGTLTSRAFAFTSEPLSAREQELIPAPRTGLCRRRRAGRASLRAAIRTACRARCRNPDHPRPGRTRNRIRCKHTFS